MTQSTCVVITREHFGNLQGRRGFAVYEDFDLLLAQPLH
jgi:hypothetical protein